MAEIVVPDLDEAVLDRHRARAAARGVPLEQELRRVLIDAARPDRDELVAFSHEIRRRQPPVDRPDVVALIREDRDR